jgi:pyroglutamyl-peptidase
MPLAMTKPGVPIATSPRPFALSLSKGQLWDAANEPALRHPALHLPTQSLYLRAAFLDRRRLAVEIALLTGFAPFDGETLNPSWEAVRALDGEEIGGRRVVAVRLPVEFHVARELLAVDLAERQPTRVLCIGQAGGRSAICIERVAINFADARIPDNAGWQPRGQRLLPAAPDGYFAPFDVDAAVAAVRGIGVPCEASLSAGSFVCNDVFFGLCHAAQHARIRGTFVHIPYAPVQVITKPEQPSMAIESVSAALRALLALPSLG